VYINFALLIIINKLFKKGKSNFILLTGFIFLLVSLLFLNSKMAIAVGYLTLFIYPVILFQKETFTKKYFKKYLFYLLVIFSAFIFSVKLYNRFEQVEKVISASVSEQTEKTDLIKSEENSTNIRSHVWKYSAQLLMKHPLTGVGTGDVKDELVKTYLENGYEVAAKGNYNPHNQFLHTGIIAGIPGMIILSLLFILTFSFALKNKDKLMQMVVLIVFLNCLTESFLERQAGIIFFTAIVFLFFRFNTSNGEVQN
jgi:O-antigen ligase